MKTAIIYYSLSGNTAYTAESIAHVLGADRIPLVPQKEYPNSGFKKFFWGGKSAVMKEKPLLEPYSFPEEEYDLVILGTPVWAGTFAPPLRTFITENMKALQDKRIAVFACCSGGPGKVIEKITKELKRGAVEAEMILIDPKDKPDADTQRRINDFCGKLSQ